MSTLKRYTIYRPERDEPVIVEQRRDGGIQIIGSSGPGMWFINPETVRKIAFAMLDLTDGIGDKEQDKT